MERMGRQNRRFGYKRLVLVLELEDRAKVGFYTAQTNDLIFLVWQAENREYSICSNLFLTRILIPVDLKLRTGNMFKNSLHAKKYYTNVKNYYCWFRRWINYS